MKIKTAKLTDRALDWVVASIEALPKDRLHLFYGKPAIDRECLGLIDTLRCEFSTNWAQGGPIIDREGIYFGPLPDKGIRAFQFIDNEYVNIMDCWGYSENISRLVVAMRCYVYSKLGEEVEVPDELCE